MNQRSNALAERLEQGARALADFAQGLSEQAWRTPITPNGRPIGVVVHHVANIYPLEIELAQLLAGGKPIEGVAWSNVHELNAHHAVEFAAATPAAAIALLQQNSAAAAAAIRALDDAALDTAAPVSLNDNAPLTCQFFLEDHAVRHSYHHLAQMRSTLGA
ncbi:MAG: DinB family protein [Gemmatimonadaceae bacterium]